MPSSNDSKVNLLVKGYRGICGFIIMDHSFKQVLYEQVQSDLINPESHEPLHTNYSDLEAIKLGLEYIRDHRGTEGIPYEPCVCVYTTYDNNYDVLTGTKQPNKPLFKKYKSEIEQLSCDLTRSASESGPDRHLSFLWVPDTFENKMTDLKGKLEAFRNKHRNKPR